MYFNIEPQYLQTWTTVYICIESQSRAVSQHSDLYLQTHARKHSHALGPGHTLIHTYRHRHRLRHFQKLSFHTVCTSITVICTYMHRCTLAPPLPLSLSFFLSFFTHTLTHTHIYMFAHKHRQTNSHK